MVSESPKKGDDTHSAYQDRFRHAENWCIRVRVSVTRLRRLRKRSSSICSSAA